MKLMYCQECGDIVAPLPTANQVRYCRCKRHAVWWVDPGRGILRVCDTHVLGNDGQPYVSRAWVIGMTNAWLGYPKEQLSKQDYADIVEEHPDYYLFKQLGSVAIRFRPGASDDTRWAPLPEGASNVV